MIEALRKVLQRLHYPLEVRLTCVRWYAAYPLSLRHIEEMMQERGVCVDHATVHRWALKMLPVLAATFRQRRRPVGKSWRMRAIALHGEPEKITIDKSGANAAAIAGCNAEHGGAIELRQAKYLNNIVEQDHRAIKRITKAMLGFKTHRSARALIAGIETMHMIRKGQLCPQQPSSIRWLSDRQLPLQPR